MYTKLKYIPTTHISHLTQWKRARKIPDYLYNCFKCRIQCRKDVNDLHVIYSLSKWDEFFEDKNNFHEKVVQFSYAKKLIYGYLLTWSEKQSKGNVH
jgi:hypothetical protein